MCYIISYRIISYRIVSYRIVSYRIVSYRITSHRITSHHIGWLSTVFYSITANPKKRFPISLYCENRSVKQLRRSETFCTPEVKLFFGFMIQWAVFFFFNGNEFPGEWVSKISCLHLGSHPTFKAIQYNSLKNDTWLESLILRLKNCDALWVTLNPNDNLGMRLSDQLSTGVTVLKLTASLHYSLIKNYCFART